MAAAVVQLAKLLGLTVLAMDDREEYAQQLRLAGADKVLCLPFDKALAQVPDGAETYFVVVTRAHAFDVDCLKVIVKKPAAYVGMMGSRGRAALVRRPLLEAGLDAERVEALYAPIGLSIGSQTAEEIALSILAQVVSKKDALILVRGGGDLATGTIHRLWSAGLRVLVLEAEHPAAIRRQVSLCEAVYEGETAVEGLRAVRIETLAQAEEIWKQNAVPVLVDPQGKSIAPAKPDVLVDAILAKKNLGTTRDMAPLTIALGPGFTAGQDVDVVVETKRGHRLGRIIREGSAIPDTGIPGIIGGYGKERVIHAGTAGIFLDLRKIGDIVEAGETIAQIRTADGAMISVTTQITGILRGLLRSSYPVTPGFKVADIDPRKEELSNCFLISDKARCIAGSVLELVCTQLWK